jgi:(2Fe-2S) ferredoxin
MKEDPEQGHWYRTVFDNRQVIKFIQEVLKQNEHSQSPKVLKPFTLTVFRPEESGSLEGWKVEEVSCLGR